MNSQGNSELFLIRHGAVSNPNHVVYGDLPGFHLSPTGVLQAHRTAEHLRTSRIDVVLTSPIERAFETATAIARHHDIEPIVDIRLTESRQFPHWTGHRWESIPVLYPGELEAYIEDADAARGHETLTEVSSRIISAIDDATSRGFRHIAVVGHQDPVQATRLALTARDLRGLRTDPPRHAEVVTLVRRDDDTWTEQNRWLPMEANG